MIEPKITIMDKLKITAALVVVFAFQVVSQNNSAVLTSNTNGSDETKELRVIDNKAFQVGEYLKYRVHYGIVDAGVAELRVQKMTVKNGRPSYHIVGTGKSVGMFNWFFKVRDRYETYLDKEAMMPWEFIRDVEEGGHEIKRHIYFNQYEQKAKDVKKSDKEYDVPANVQDILSAFYYARSADYSNLKKGDMIEINTFVDHEVFPLNLKFDGYETIKTKFGEIYTMRFLPVVQKGRIFKEEDGVFFWITADANHVPVRVESELAVGSIKMDLIEYKGLKNKINFR